MPIDFKFCIFGKQFYLIANLNKTTVFLCYCICICVGATVFLCYCLCICVGAIGYFSVIVFVFVWEQLGPNLFWQRLICLGYRLLLHWALPHIHIIIFCSQKYWICSFLDFLCISYHFIFDTKIQYCIKREVVFSYA